MNVPRKKKDFPLKPDPELALEYPESAKTPARERMRDINRVGQYCQKQFSRTEVLTKKQERFIGARLKTFTAKQLVTLVDYIKAESWYAANGQTEITSIFCSDERVRQNLDRAFKRQASGLDAGLGPSKRPVKTKRL